MKRIKSRIIKKMNEKMLTKIFELKIIGVFENSFIRNRILSFKDVVTIILGWKGRTTRMELFDFYKKAEKKAISKQDFSKQRMKIKEEFWIESVKITAKTFYEDLKYKKFGKYILLGIDGCKTILPRCEELEKKYGIANANNSQQKCVQCLISGCYDLLNNIMLDIQIAPYASDERELAKKNIEEVLKYNFKHILIVFDRGYPSLDMINFMEEHEIKYIFRMQKSTYEKEKRNMKSDDEFVNIEINKDRLSNKMSEKIKEKLKQRKYINTRFIRCKLSSGNEEWLCTNLTKKEANMTEMMELYFKRWNIEECYNTLKNKLEIENISGKCDITVRQDIYATIIIYNMIEADCFLLNDEIVNEDTNRYDYKLNENILIGAFKELFIEVIITEKEKKKNQLYELLYEYALRCKTAIIPNRPSNPRIFRGGSTKCKVNMKRSF